MISKLVSGGQNGDAMRNSMPKTNHHGAKREDVAALASLKILHGCIAAAELSVQELQKPVDYRHHIAS